MNPRKRKWIQVILSEPKGTQVNPSEPKWAQVNPSEPKCTQVKPNESKWTQKEPKWTQGIYYDSLLILVLSIQAKFRWTITDGVCNINGWVAGGGEGLLPIGLPRHFYTQKDDFPRFSLQSRFYWFSSCWGNRKDKANNEHGSQTSVSLFKVRFWVTPNHCTVM